MSKWKSVKLGDVCIIERGGSPRPIDKFITDSDDGINWIKIGDTNNSKYILRTAQKITKEGAKKSRSVEAGDFLLSNSMSFGRPYILKIDGCIHDGWLVIRDVNEIFNKDYLYYYLSSPFMYEHFKTLAVGGVVNNLNSKMVRNVFIPLPPLEIQHQIAENLDKVTHLIDLCHQILDRLDLLVKSRFVEMFIGRSYPTMFLDSLSLKKGEYGAQSAAIEYDENRPRYVRITDINDDGTLNDDRVSSSDPDDDIQYKLEYGDFLFARMGATVGKTYAYKTGNQIYAGYLIRYKLDLQKILPDYLYVYTKLGVYQDWVKLNQSGAAQPGINAKKYGSLQIPVAPLYEQKQFAAFVAQTDKSKLAVKQVLERAETLKKAMMQEYFG